MHKELLIQIFLIVVGVFTLLGASLKWNFFLKNRKARLIVHLFGQSGARIFYALIGSILVIMAVLDILNIIDLQLLFEHKII
nr:immunity 17 family protein [uncultured Carboxylicivirga sp.]